MEIAIAIIRSVVSIFIGIALAVAIEYYRR